MSVRSSIKEWVSSVITDENETAETKAKVINLACKCLSEDINVDSLTASFSHDEYQLIMHLNIKPEDMMPAMAEKFTGYLKDPHNYLLTNDRFGKSAYIGSITVGTKDGYYEVILDNISLEYRGKYTFSFRKSDFYVNPGFCVYPDFRRA